MQSAGSSSGNSANTTIGSTSSAATATANSPNRPPKSAPSNPNVNLKTPTISAPNSHNTPPTTSTSNPNSSISTSCRLAALCRTHLRVQYGPFRRSGQHDSWPVTFVACSYYQVRYSVLDCTTMQARRDGGHRHPPQEVREGVGRRHRVAGAAGGGRGRG